MRRITPVAAAFLAVGMTVSATTAFADEAVVQPLSETTVTTHFYKIGMQRYQLSTPTPWVTYSRDATVLALGADSGLGQNPLRGGSELTYPITSFNLSTSTERTLGSIDFTPIVGAGSFVRILDFQYFRDLQDPGSDTANALVSLASYNPNTGCRRTYVNEIRIDLASSGRNVLGRRWFTLPCLRVANPPEDVDTRPVLHQSGGRLAVVPKGQWSGRTPEIYVSTGDFQVLASEWNAVPQKVRRLLSSVHRVTEAGRVSVVASGLRNPQGMANVALDGTSQLVTSTHGPRGGDELDVIQQGADFGWPKESYGTAYDSRPQHKPKVEGALPRADLPAFAWVPSIGPSAVLQVAGSAFRSWWGSGPLRSTADLLVSGMGTQSLYRVRWQDGAVRYVEAIELAQRIRSMTLSPTGDVVAGTDGGLMLLLHPLQTWSTQLNAYQ